MELKSNKRTLDWIKANAIQGECGCENLPLFNLETDYVVADELHLLL